MALVLLALRALLCVALRRPALPCVRFVFSGRDELISTVPTQPGLRERIIKRCRLSKVPRGAKRMAVTLFY